VADAEALASELGGGISMSCGREPPDEQADSHKIAGPSENEPRSFMNLLCEAAHDAVHHAHRGDLTPEAFAR
jgi:hypothetical protein